VGAFNHKIIDIEGGSDIRKTVELEVKTGKNTSKMP
jgi:hypothetical protein